MSKTAERILSTLNATKCRYSPEQNVNGIALGINAANIRHNDRDCHSETVLCFSLSLSLSRFFSISLVIQRCMRSLL